MQPIKVYLRFRSTSSQLHHASQQRKQHSLDTPTIRHYVSTKYSSAVSTVCRRYISCCSAELNCSTLGPVPLSGVYPIGSPFGKFAERAKLVIKMAQGVPKMFKL